MKTTFKTLLQFQNNDLHSAIENMDLDTIITVDDTINKAWEVVYIHIGDKISLRDLLYGLMLRSGNDASLMIAKAVGKR